MQANGFANDDPAILAVDVDAFYSWSACRMKITSIALIISGSILKVLSLNLKFWVNHRVVKKHVEEILNEIVLLFGVNNREPGGGSERVGS